MDDGLDDVDLGRSATPSPQVPYPKGHIGPRDYFSITGSLLSDARREFGLGPFGAVAAEAAAVPMLLVAIQAAVLAVASSFQIGDGAALLGARGFGIEVSVWTAAAIVLVGGGTSGLLSFYARSRINKYAVRYELACSARAAAHFVGQRPNANIKQAVAAIRVDSRSCGSALRLLLLSLPWSLALFLIVPLLLWIQWTWTIVLGVGAIAAGLALLALNRRTVRATHNLDAMKDASGLELLALLRAKGEAAKSTDLRTWQGLNTRYLNAFEHRLQIPVRTQAVTTLLFAMCLALMVPLITLGEAAQEIDVLLIVFYLILLRVGFGYMGRVATLLMGFNQQFPNVRRYRLTVTEAAAQNARTVAIEEQVGS